MYSVYSDDKVIRFTDLCGTADAVLLAYPHDTQITAKVMEKLGNNNSICVKCDDPADVFADFRNGFAQVEAAGGLVRNSAGDTLMIFRNDRWDLPKGHLDPNEDCIRCAMREVREECGLVNLAIGDFICKTYHIYMYNGRWTLKETIWYSMFSDDTALTPQIEEGIEKAQWVAAYDVAPKLEAAYPLITDVFAAAGG